MATARQIRNRGRFSLLLGTLVAAILFAAVAYAGPDPAPSCAQTGVETVATDKGDYAPEEVVHITGDGYAATCAVVVRVTRPDGSVVVGDGSFAPGSDTVTTGASGELAYDYQLDGILGEYHVDVLGAGDVVLASTTFTDALSLGQDNVDIAPAFTLKPTGASTTTAMSILVEQDSVDTPINCIRLTFPASWTVNSASVSNVSAGTWGGTTTATVSGTFAKVTSTGGSPGGLPPNRFVRIEVLATTPATDGTGTVGIVVSNSAANTLATAACSGTTNAQSVATIWDDVWPAAPARVYTADFRNSGGAVISPSAAVGVSTTYRVRFTLTGTAPTADDRMSYALLALPPCFGSISITGTTAFSPSVTRIWTSSVVDNMIRLRRSASGNELLDENPDNWVQVEFNATATNACGAGSYTWATAPWGNSTSPNSNSSTTRVFGITGSHPTMTVTSPTPTVSTTIHESAGDTAVTAVGVGTNVHDFVSVTGASGPPTGTVTLDWFLNGTCAGSPAATSAPLALTGGQVDATSFNFTVNSAGKRAFLAHYSGDGSYTPLDGPCETLTVVDANIQISPDGVNRVGQLHTLTAHVNVNDGNGFTNAPDGTNITFSINGNPPSLSCSTSGGTGSCQVSYTSAVTGVDTIAASTSVAVAGVSMTRTTNGTGGNSGPATKRWVNARILIAPSATNEVGKPHTFIVTLEKDTGDGSGFQPAVGEHVGFVLIDSNDAVSVLDSAASSCDDPGPNTNAAGQCTIVFNSSSAGQVTGHAAAVLSVAGSAPFSVATDGQGANSADAVKTYVDANIQISPLTDTNPVGANHVLTAHVNVNDGSGSGFQNAPGGTTVVFSIPNGFGSFVGPFICGTVGTTGTCQATITSSTPGTSTIRATTTVTIGGVALKRATGDGKPGDSLDATKYWADDVVTTVVRDAEGHDITNTTVSGGIVVHDEATVSKAPGTPAEAPNPGGTVTFTLYNNGTCNGAVVATDPNEPLNGSGTASSAPFVIPAAVGPYSYLAHYNGDDNYPPQDGPCEPFNFDGVPPATTITLDPAQPDVCCWYTFAVKPTVSATDVGTGVLETRCVLDPATPPTSFADLPPGMCPYSAPSSWVVTEGVHTLYAGSIDNSTPGNTDLVQVTFKIDRSAPTSQVSPLPQFQPSPGPFTVSWSGSDNLSGIKDFDVRYRTAPAGGSFGGYTQWFTDTTLTSASFTPTPGSTVCFSVRARDRACWEQFTYSPEVCTTAPYDDPSLTRTGSWSTVSGSGYFGPGVSRSTGYGNKLTLSGLRASVVGVLVTKQPGGGPIELRWNGSTKLSTSLSAASVQKKQLLTFTLPSVQTGTLEIVQTNYGTVDIDAAGAWKAS